VQNNSIFLDSIVNLEINYSTTIIYDDLYVLCMHICMYLFYICMHPLLIYLLQTPFCLFIGIGSPYGSGRSDQSYERTKKIHPVNEVICFNITLLFNECIYLC
jgi:hypothetical protein